MPKPVFVNRILATCGILSFLAIVVVFDLGCPSGDSGSDDPKPVVSVSVSRRSPIDFSFELRNFCERMETLLEFLDAIECGLAGLLDEKQEALLDPY